jgi:hypothetical protein
VHNVGAATRPGGRRPSYPSRFRSSAAP